MSLFITCFIEKRQRGRFAGFSLYVSYTGEISELPPLNFTATCTEIGRYVIFYNERLDAVTYPDGYELLNVYIEFCEVVVEGKYCLFTFSSYII